MASNNIVNILVTLVCTILGLGLLYMDIYYPFFIGSGILYVCLLAIIIMLRSYAIIIIMMIFYLMLSIIGYYIYTVGIYQENEMLLQSMQTDFFEMIIKPKMLIVRLMGICAIAFTSAMGFLQLRRSRNLEDKQRQLSMVDFLTGAYSRRFIFEYIKQRVSDIERYPENNFSVIMFDIDKFKNINDTYSHPGGDVVLQQVVECAKNTIRNVDVIGRCGGEEFLIVLPNSDIAGSMFLAERLRTNIAQLKVEFSSQIITLTISLGVTDFRSFGFTNEKQIELAVDKALYRAKNSGRNRVIRVDERDFIQTVKDLNN